MTRAIRAAAMAVGVLLVMIAAACGRSSTSEPVAVGTPSQAPAPPTGAAGGPLPTLPPIQQRSPELFDANGCRKVTADQASCASTGGQIDAAAAAESPDGSRTLAGFVGKHWSTAAPIGAVTVLEPTINASATADGRWQALGLVRNEAAPVIAGAAVTAELVGHDGGVIETVRANAEVHSLRSGEPAPFVLSAETAEASDVASVRWSAAETTTPAADPSSRSIELRTFWTRMPDDGRRIDTEQHHDPASGPLPFVLFGSAVNQGSAAIAGPHVVLAWFDANGRVVAVRDVAGTNDVGPMATLPVGGAADFLAAVEAPDLAHVPPDLLGTPTMWGAGT